MALFAFFTLFHLSLNLFFDRTCPSSKNLGYGDNSEFSKNSEISESLAGQFPVILCLSKQFSS